MTIRIAPEEMALHMRRSLGHYFEEDTTPMSVPTPPHRTLMTRLRDGLRWLADLPRRQAVIDELSALSDYELADIGLTRGELPMVFDAGFAAERNRTRFGGYHDDSEQRAA
jgi:uncharacterized protein YjiS (DUF1127 family)